MKPKDFSDQFNTILVFDSSAAVGLLVADNMKPDRAHTGAFITPETAREIAAALIEAAEKAEDNRRNAPTREEAKALIESWGR